MWAIILGYLKSFQMVMDNADYNVGSKTRICYQVRFKPARLLSRDLQASLQIIHYAQELHR